MTHNINAVASNIRSLRLFRNYSQDYLAARLNISQNAYSKIERGQTRLTLDKLMIIAEVLAVDPLKLIQTKTGVDELQAIKKISALPKILNIVCNITGMGFAAVVHVTNNKVVACMVRDEITIGLQTGRELDIESTMWNEILESGKGIVIEHVKEDEIFCEHPVPAMYGLQSYIAVPIIRRDGTFFGALCAMDRKPRKVNNRHTVETFELFAELISYNLSL